MSLRSVDSAANEKPRGPPKKKTKPEKDDEGNEEEDSKQQSGKPKRGKVEAWTAEQRKALVLSMCASSFSHMDWNEVSAQCGGRTVPQVKMYWRNVLKAKLEKALEEM
ncbi:Myb-like domain [Ceraceosorus bombacis]|uniref:Myb-like domain n=1 Tax=Ceraceosorus bombacis TaxID=401625 RepID=A0A0P1BBW9_9BASI|nr:Myb-like domain [Ceraceosorus bombacis]